MDCRSVVFIGVLGIVGASPVWDGGYGGYDTLKNHGYYIHPVSFRLAEEVFHPPYDEAEKRRKAFEREHEILKVKIGANHPELIPHLERDSELTPHDVLYKPPIYDVTPHDVLYKPPVYDVAPHDVLYKPSAYNIAQQYGLSKPEIYNNGLFTKKNHGEYGYHMHGTYQNEINYIPYK